MNKIITTNGQIHKRAVSNVIIMLVVIVWIIFSAVYIIQDRWDDYQVSQMQQAYQGGVSAGVANSVRTLMTEVSKCNKVPLYYGNTTVEVVAMSCLSTPQGDADEVSSDDKKPAAKKAEEPVIENPTVSENPNEPKMEQPPTQENPNDSKAEQYPATEQPNGR